MPTLPRAENAATSTGELVMPFHGWLVRQLVPLVQVAHGEHLHTSLVMSRGCSTAPTVITFLAVAGERMVSGSPPCPESSPLLGAPTLPAAKTNNNGCEPVIRGKASRVAAS